MDSNTKQLLAVFSLMLGLSWGIPYLVSEEKNSSWLMLSIIFLVLAGLLWFWLMREQRTAEEAAHDALDAAEENKKKIEIKAADEQSAPAPVPDTPQESDSADDDVVEETKAEELVETPTSVEEIEEVAEEAKSGDPVAETEIAEASAAPETSSKSEIEVELEAEEQAEIANDTDADAEELAEDAVTDTGDVDLTIIEGIGPKYAEILTGAGVDTFAKLAAMTTDEVVDLVKSNGGRKSGSMPTWVEQAKLAAKGDWDALEKLQDDLAGGRR